jgi:hypothetical protein
MFYCWIAVSGILNQWASRPPGRTLETYMDNIGLYTGLRTEDLQNQLSWTTESYCMLSSGTLQRLKQHRICKVVKVSRTENSSSIVSHSLWNWNEFKEPVIEHILLAQKWPLDHGGKSNSVGLQYTVSVLLSSIKCNSSISVVGWFHVERRKCLIQPIVPQWGIETC